MFGGAPGPLRLLNSALGGQAGWLLGFAAASALALAAASRLRRSDPRTGWLIVVGGAFLMTAALFSEASGIFHPYYVSLLAPSIAALVGAGAAQLIAGRLSARIVGPAAIAAGCAAELAVLAHYPGQLPWLAPVLIAVGALAIVALVALHGPRARIAAVGAVVAALLIAPSVWAFDTLGHATERHVPGRRPGLGRERRRPRRRPGGLGGRARPRSRRTRPGSAPALFGPPGAGAGGVRAFARAAGSAGAGAAAPGGGAGRSARLRESRRRGPGRSRGGGAFGAPISAR